MFVYPHMDRGPATPEKLLQVAERLEGLGEMWRQEMWAVREAAEVWARERAELQRRRVHVDS